MIEGVENFRKVLLIVSLIFSLVTLMIMIGENQGCEGSHLEVALWLCFSIHITTFVLILFHYIGLSNILQKLGKCLGLYFFYLVTSMFVAQVVFFKSQNCHIKAPLLFFWLVVQIIIFYVLVAYGIALWGAYICWAAE